jgi:hypothetical protein
MLENEKAMPHNLGYDKPTDLFIGFLRKHYGLMSYVP